MMVEETVEFGGNLGDILEKFVDFILFDFDIIARDRSIVASGKVADEFGAWHSIEVIGEIVGIKADVIEGIVASGHVDERIFAIEVGVFLRII